MGFASATDVMEEVSSATVRTRADHCCFDSGSTDLLLTSRIDRTARRAAMAEQLHAVADCVRFLFGAEAIPAASASLRTIAGRCRELWEARDRLLPARGTPLEPGLEQQIRTDLSDLVVLWAYLHVLRAADPEKD